MTERPAADPATETADDLVIAHAFRWSLVVIVGIALIAGAVILLASGRGKADAIAKAVEGPITSMITASAIQMHPDAEVIIDEDAASELKMRDYYEFIYQAKLGAPKT